MSDPTRLLRGEGSEPERALLAAAAAEEPPGDGARRLALALGLTTAGLGSGSPAGAGSESTAPAAGAPGTLAKWLGAKVALKLALFVAAGALLTVALLPGHPAPRAPAAQPSPAAPSPAESSATGARAVAPLAASIADEIARLDAARRALAAQEPERALATLAAYAQRYPHGTLAPEALRLRVESFLAKGDVPRARQLAREFLRAFPDSPHASALRRVAQAAAADAASETPAVPQAVPGRAR